MRANDAPCSVAAEEASLHKVLLSTSDLDVKESRKLLINEYSIVLVSALPDRGPQAPRRVIPLVITFVVDWLFRRPFV
jgi:hypothetical protein